MKCFAKVYVKKEHVFEEKKLTLVTRFIDCGGSTTITDNPKIIHGCLLKKGDSVKVSAPSNYIFLNDNNKYEETEYLKAGDESDTFYFEVKLRRKAVVIPFDVRSSLRHVIRNVSLSDDYEGLLRYPNGFDDFYKDIASEYHLDTQEVESLLKNQASKTLARPKGVSYREKVVSCLILNEKDSAADIVLNKNYVINQELKKRIREPKKIRLEKELQGNVTLLNFIRN